MASSYRHARGKRALGGQYYGAPRSIPCHECGKHIPVRALKDINIRGDKVFCDKCAPIAAYFRKERFQKVERAY